MVFHIVGNCFWCIRKAIQMINFATLNIFSPFGFVSALRKVPPSFWQTMQTLELLGVTVDLKRFGKFKDDEFSSNTAARDEDGVGLSLFDEINVASLFFYANFCLSAPLPKFYSNCCSRLYGKLCVLNINSDLLNCLIA